METTIVALEGFACKTVPSSSFPYQKVDRGLFWTIEITTAEYMCSANFIRGIRSSQVHNSEFVGAGEGGGGRGKKENVFKKKENGMIEKIALFRAQE